MRTNDFLHALEDERIARAIEEAENQTSGEIRVYITDKNVLDPLPEAERQFINLGMAKTEQGNGVLIYFAPRSQSFAIVGDKAVHEKCGQPFWEEITKKMAPLLKDGKFTEAILVAIQEAGEALSRNFPRTAGDRNELPNQVIRERDTPPG